MIRLNFDPFPILKTERLLLRKLSDNDKNDLFRLRTDEEVSKYLDRPKYKDVTQSLDFIERINSGIDSNEWIYWVIEYENKFAGTICIWNISVAENKAEVGYELLPEYHHMGIMTEAMKKVIEYSFNELKFDKLEAIMDSMNEKSIGLLKRTNFRYRGSFEEKDSKETKMITMDIYTLENKEQDEEKR